MCENYMFDEMPNVVWICFDVEKDLNRRFVCVVSLLV